MSLKYRNIELGRQSISMDNHRICAIPNNYNTVIDNEITITVRMTYFTLQVKTNGYTWRRLKFNTFYPPHDNIVRHIRNKLRGDVEA